MPQQASKTHPISSISYATLEDVSKLSCIADRNVFCQEASPDWMELDQVIEFRHYVRNIAHWGMHKRLEYIRGCSDALMEGKRLHAAHEARNSQPSSMKGNVYIPWFSVNMTI